MLLNTYTAKGRAVARTLSTSTLRDEMRLVAGAACMVTLTNDNGQRTSAHGIRLAKWLQTFLAPLPAAPDSAVEDGEALHLLVRTNAGEIINCTFWAVDTWPVYRALAHSRQSAIKVLKRQIARNTRRIVELEALLKGGEGRTV